MKENTQLQQVSKETMRFMRGNFLLDEIPGKYNEIDCLHFREGEKTILSILIHEDYYDFHFVFDKTEQEAFTAQLSEFPAPIQDLYRHSSADHDDLSLLIRVDTIEMLEAVKKLILIKIKPNRTPFPKEQAVYGDCGHRCDLCIHYGGGAISEKFRIELRERFDRVYGAYDGEVPICYGCAHGGLSQKHDCIQKKCATDKGIDKCANCDEYPCEKATAGWPPKIELKHVLADDVTWMILPYVDNQYGN